MPLPLESTPNVSTKTNLFVFKDTVTNGLYLCISEAPITASSSISSRTNLPANTRCTRLLKDAATGLDSACPSTGSTYPEKSYATYDAGTQTLFVYEAKVTDNTLGKCTYNYVSNYIRIPAASDIQNSLCPSQGEYYGAKSYSTYDPNSRTLRVVAAKVVGPNCQVQISDQTVTIPDASSLQTCPSNGSVWPEKSYSDYDSTKSKLTVYKAVVSSTNPCNFNYQTYVIDIPTSGGGNPPPPPPPPTTTCSYSTGEIYPEKSYVFYDKSLRRLTIIEAIITDPVNCKYTVITENVDLHKPVGNFTMRVFYTYNGGYYNSSLSGPYNVSNLWEGYDPTFPSGDHAAVSPYGIGYLLLDWEWPRRDPNIRVVLSFSSPVAGKGLGFANEHHQGGNLSSAYFSNTVTVTTKVNGNFVHTTYVNAIVLKLTVEPGGNSWYGWGTVTASFYNVANPNAAYPVYSIPVFVKYLN